MTVASARAKPVHTVLSGPAGGVVAAAEIASLSHIDNIITMDMGGTSTDISLIIDARPQITSQASLEGMPVRIPVVDINAIGAGGGSIAHIDEGGALRVGPQSAEAEPGPACYGRGGKHPAVTDANLLLGRLGIDTALGGELTLDLAAARQAIEKHIAEPLGIDPVSAAAGIIRIANANMERGIRVVSVERGHDPREFVLVPFGGAGPLHSNAIAANLSIPKVMVPPAPGILCAMGMLMSDLRHDLIETRILPLAGLKKADLMQLFSPLLARAEQLLADDGIAPEQRRFTSILDMRYIGQGYELMIPVASLGEADADSLTRMFHAAHLKKFDHADKSAPIEIVNLRVLAVGQRPPFDLPRLPAGDARPAEKALRGYRKVYFSTSETTGSGTWLDSPVWQREELLAGNRIDGPAVIEELSSTTLLRPGDIAEIDHCANIMIQIRT